MYLLRIIVLVPRVAPHAFHELVEEEAPPLRVVVTDKARPVLRRIVIDIA